MQRAADFFNTESERPILDLVGLNAECYVWDATYDGDGFEEPTDAENVPEEFRERVQGFVDEDLPPLIEDLLTEQWWVGQNEKVPGWYIATTGPLEVYIKPEAKS